MLVHMRLHQLLISEFKILQTVIMYSAVRNVYSITVLDMIQCAINCHNLCFLIHRQYRPTKQCPRHISGDTFIRYYRSLARAEHGPPEALVEMSITRWMIGNYTL